MKALVVNDRGTGPRTTYWRSLRVRRASMLGMQRGRRMQAVKRLVARHHLSV